MDIDLDEENLHLHGIEYFSPYILNKKIPPMHMISDAKAVVKRLVLRWNLPYERALEDVVRSITNGAKRKFKKDVRHWTLKTSQGRSCPLEIDDYEKCLAEAIDNFDQDNFQSKNRSKHVENDLDGKYNKDESPKYNGTLLPTVRESDTPEVAPADGKVPSTCSLHKKDCRTWLYKSSSKKKSIDVCQWFKNMCRRKDSKERLCDNSAVLPESGDDCRNDAHSDDNNSDQENHKYVHTTQGQAGFVRGPGSYGFVSAYFKMLCKKKINK